MATLQVRKDDLSLSRIAEREAPVLKDGQLLAQVGRFALTANNVTYGVVGEKFGYWNFFPAPDGWGVIPVWGFADVVASRHPEVAVGERLYGYLPMGTHLVIEPARVSATSLIDGFAHRAALPKVYNAYARTRAEADYDPSLDDERMLLFPLYVTSFCLYDYLSNQGWFGAKQLLILSASSKTAIGLALALAGDAAAPPAIALTSARHRERVGRLGLYVAVHDYDDFGAIDVGVPTVIADMSGNGALLSSLHERLGDNMRYCANVGVTHYAENRMGPHFIAERSALFFAPSHIQQRARDWGPGILEKKAFAFWRKAALQSRTWLKFDRERGTPALQAAYHRVLNGESAPDRGLVVELP